MNLSLRSGLFIHIQKPQPKLTQKYRFGLGLGPRQSIYWILFWPAGLDLGLYPIQNPTGYSKYLKYFLYIRYIWVFQIYFWHYKYFFKFQIRVLSYSFEFQEKIKNLKYISNIWIMFWVFMVYWVRFRVKSRVFFGI